MRRALAIGVGVVVVAFVGWVFARALVVTSAYAAASSNLDSLRRLSTLDAAALTPETLVQARSDLQALSTQLARLDDATSLPVSEQLLANVPWLGPRYAAARTAVRLGSLGVSVGATVTEVGEDLLATVDSSSANTGGDQQGWLGVLAQHQDSLTRARRDLAEMRTLRAQVADELLPARLQARLREFDRLFARSELQAAMSVDVPTVLHALGASAPARYLVVFQNPAELRPSGGFPGTMALVTVEHGQLQSYEFFDAHELTDAYLSHRGEHVPQPWPIEHFFPQDGLLLHDALWWSDFPRSGQQFMDMYAETGWPPIDGVIAVQPDLASQLLGITGPFTVDFEGQTRRITADNVYGEIERQRRSGLTSADDALVHKDMLGLIGKNLIDRLKQADRRALGKAAHQFLVACQRRDVQIYVADPTLEAALDQQRCTGRLEPQPDVPTLAITYANVVLSKTSLDMRPTVAMSIGRVADGRRQVTMTIDLRNGAIADEDSVYHGFQRWWVEVVLPSGSTLLSDPGPMANPESPSGGSYLAAIYPDTVGRIDVVFSMPDTPTLLVRRQPGVRPGYVIASRASCPPGYDSELTSDLEIDLADLPCPD
jgi:Protein of unknown function (DUF4012)